MIRGLVIAVLVTGGVLIGADLITSGPRSIASFADKFRLPPSSLSSSLPRLGEVSSFNLIDADGRPFLSSELNGKIWAINFFFAECPQVCPRVNSVMADLAAIFKENSKVHFVSITVQPERDTPEMLRKYRSKFKSVASKWSFLTGSHEEIEKLAVESFKVGGLKDRNIHTSRIMLVDNKMSLRGYFSTEQDVVDSDPTGKIKTAISTLLAE